MKMQLIVNFTLIKFPCDIICLQPHQNVTLTPSFWQLKLTFNIFIAGY